MSSDFPSGDLGPTAPEGGRVRPIARLAPRGGGISILIAVACIVAAPALADESGGISSTAISRCAGKMGQQTREADPAFALIMLDGAPWVKIDRTARTVDGQAIATTVTGTGARHLRRGQTVYFRFTCLLDDKGEVVTFRSNDALPDKGDMLPPAVVVSGSATYLQKMRLPRGAELRVQLLDLAKAPDSQVLTEQAVRSGWEVPIPFAMRLPQDTPLQGRKLAIAARLVEGPRILFQLKEPLAVPVADLGRRVDLLLEQVQGN